jgi:hypothetical protein
MSWVGTLSCDPSIRLKFQSSLINSLT